MQGNKVAMRLITATAQYDYSDIHIALRAFRKYSNSMLKCVVVCDVQQFIVGDYAVLRDILEIIVDDAHAPKRGITMELIAFLDVSFEWAENMPHPQSMRKVGLEIFKFATDFKLRSFALHVNNREYLDIAFVDHFMCRVLHQC